MALYTSSYKNSISGGIEVGIYDNKRGMQVCSLVSHLNSHSIPKQRDLRGIVEGRSVTGSRGWLDTFNPAFFGRCSAEIAFDQRAEFNGLENSITAHRINVVDTLNDEGRAMFEAVALAAFDARVIELRAAEPAPVATHEVVEPIFGERIMAGTLEQCRRHCFVSDLHGLTIHPITKELPAPPAVVEVPGDVLQPVPALYSVKLEAVRLVRTFSGPKKIVVAGLTVNHTQDNEQSEACRAAAQKAIDDFATAPDDSTVIHAFMQVAYHAVPVGTELEWRVTVSFN